MFILFGVFIHLAFAQVTIRMEPLTPHPTELDADDPFAGYYLEPAGATTARTCASYCPAGGDTTADNCPPPNVLGYRCSGGITADLSAHTKINFEWLPSANETKWLEVVGNGRTRIEFQALYDCTSDTGTYQEISGANIKWDFEFVDNQGAAQKYAYNAGESFVNLGKCDGCAECDIYTRLQFDPDTNGDLQLNFKKLTFSADYDKDKVVTGSQEYYWGTDRYCWIRSPQERRRRQLAGTTYTLHELSDLKPGNSGTAGMFITILVAILILFM